MDALHIKVVGLRPMTKGSVTAFAIPNKDPSKKPRAVVVHGDRGEARQRLRSWDAEVKAAARAELERRGIASPFVERGRGVSIQIVFRIARPAGHFSKATGLLLASAPADPSVKPDRDKLERAILDALTGLAFFDDAQVVAGPTVKRYVEKTTDEGVTIIVQPRPRTVAEARQMEIQTGGTAQ